MFRASIEMRRVRVGDKPTNLNSTKELPQHNISKPSGRMGCTTIVFQNAVYYAIPSVSMPLVVVVEQ